MNYFEVEVSYIPEHSCHRVELGEWRGLAEHIGEANTLARAALWAKELDDAQRQPQYAVWRMDRYLVSEGWRHFFAGNTESMTRWVLDRLTEKLAYAEVAGTGLKSSTWYPLSASDKDDLLESFLQANDILHDLDALDIKELDRLPDWAAQALGAQEEMEPAPQSLVVIESSCEQSTDSSAMEEVARSARRKRP